MRPTADVPCLRGSATPALNVLSASLSRLRMMFAAHTHNVLPPPSCRAARLRFEERQRTMQPNTRLLRWIITGLVQLLRSCYSRPDTL